MRWCRSVLVALSSVLTATHVPALAQGAPAAIGCEPAMLVFDASGSMLGTRITQARAAVHRVMPALAARRAVGLLTYGGTGESVACASIRLRSAPVVTNGAAILGEIDTIVPSGRTPLTQAVATAVDFLRRAAPAGLVVLVTDGEENCGGDPCELGRRLKDTGTHVTVHVIGFRLRIEEGSSLACLANQTGGRFVEVDDTDSLSAALDQSFGCAPVSVLGRRLASTRPIAPRQSEALPAGDALSPHSVAARPAAGEG